MKIRPLVDKPVEYGNTASFWVEYPSGLVDLSRSTHLRELNDSKEPLRTQRQRDVVVEGNRIIRIDTKKSALVVIDMQK